MSPLDAIVVVGLVTFVGVVALAMRARERYVRELLARFGLSADATVVEYVESEDGYHITYRFTTEHAPANVERTEPLAARPPLRPRPGQSLEVKYLPSLPSISRAAIETLQ